MARPHNDFLYWTPDLSNGPAGKNDYQRQDDPGQEQQHSVLMCHETAHFLSSCPILAEYTRLGKVSRNMQNLLVLGQQ